MSNEREGTEMEIIAFAIALVAIFAVKSAAILRYQDDEISNSTLFSWTKPGARESVVVPDMAVEPARMASSSAWSPTLASQRLRNNRIAVAR